MIHPTSDSIGKYFCSASHTSHHSCYPLQDSPLPICYPGIFNYIYVKRTNEIINRLSFSFCK
ncbi:hypothetical protein L211DRAFT_619346 [Terfezia boudieri ATCC MYA-4762]|uniref:Uncharacterized protein n=1 Tax=Terfezia boudieri ATCC MYA-4762 TaxID=1051890 RepID=A0A3N4M2U9_9PEZI|nr:hypothetical protein L211DRAFT_619346 [Terfezia boudieri ATCC MYA-4762]